MSIIPLLVAALASATGDEVVARVDQVTITRSAVSRRVDFAARMRMTVTPAEAAESLVNDVLLAAEARRLGLGDPKAISAFVEQELRKTAVAALVESFATRREPDEAMLREMFHATADFVAYEFLAYGTEQDARAARKRIEAGAKFGDEVAAAVTARLHPKPSDAPFAMRAQLGVLAGPLLAASPGALVGPLENETGWFLARILRKEIGSDADFAARRPALLASLRKQTLDAGRSHLVEQLRAKKNVKLDEAFLNGLTGGVPSAAQLQHVIATVGGAPVRYADVYPKIAALGGQGGHLASGLVKIQLATQVVDERLLDAFAAEKGVDKAPEVAAARPELERNALSGLVAARIHAAVKRPTKIELERYYAANRARFPAPIDAVRPRVEAELLSVKRHEALQARLAELRAKASISMNPAAPARAGG